MRLAVHSVQRRREWMKCSRLAVSQASLDERNKTIAARFFIVLMPGL